jgi:hypothetical protein
VGDETEYRVFLSGPVAVLTVRVKSAEVPVWGGDKVTVGKAAFSRDKVIGVVAESAYHHDSVSGAPGK